MAAPVEQGVDLEALFNNQSYENPTKRVVTLVEHHVDSQLRKVGENGKIIREIKKTNQANPQHEPIPLPDTGAWSAYHYPSVGRTTLTLTHRGDKKPSWEVLVQEVSPDTRAGGLAGRWMKVSGPSGSVEVVAPYPETPSAQLKPSFSFSVPSPETNGHGPAAPDRLAKGVIEEFGSLDIPRVSRPHVTSDGVVFIAPSGIHK
ncbi:MAG: hypothetical protein ACREHC_07980 [Candidatus Levyibacteriota bacterium]